MNKTIPFFLQLTAVLCLMNTKWWKTFEPKLMEIEQGNASLSEKEQNSLDKVSQKTGVSFADLCRKLEKIKVQSRIEHLQKALGATVFENEEFDQFLYEDGDGVYLSALVLPLRQQRNTYRLIWESASNHPTYNRLINGQKVLTSHLGSGVQKVTPKQCFDSPQLKLYLCIAGLEQSDRVLVPLFHLLDNPRTHDSILTLESEREFWPDLLHRRNLRILSLFLEILKTVDDFHTKAGCFHGRIDSKNVFWSFKDGRFVVTIGNYENALCPKDPFDDDPAFVPTAERDTDCLGPLKNALRCKVNLKDSQYDKYRKADYQATGYVLREILRANQGEIDLSDEVGLGIQSIANSLSAKTAGNPEVLKTAIDLATRLLQKPEVPGENLFKII